MDPRKGSFIKIHLTMEDREPRCIQGYNKLPAHVEFHLILSENITCRLSNIHLLNTKLFSINYNLVNWCPMFLLDSWRDECIVRKPVMSLVHAEGWCGSGLERHVG